MSSFKSSTGGDELTAPVRVTREAIVFEFPVRVGAPADRRAEFSRALCAGTGGRALRVRELRHARRPIRLVLDEAREGVPDVDRLAAH